MDCQAEKSIYCQNNKNVSRVTLVLHGGQIPNKFQNSITKTVKKHRRCSISVGLKDQFNMILVEDQ